MARETGSAAFVSFKGTPISTDFTEFKHGGEMGVTDATAGADTFEVNLTTYRKGKGSMKAYYAGGTAATDIYNLLIEGASGTLIVGDEGTATGKPKMTVNTAIVTKREKTTGFNKAVEIAVDFVYNSTPSDSAF